MNVGYIAQLTNSFVDQNLNLGTFYIYLLFKLLPQEIIIYSDCIFLRAKLNSSV